MNPKRLYAVVLRQFYLMRGSLSRVLPLFAWVTVDIVLWGFLTRYLNSVASTGFSFVATLLGAVLLWDFFMRVMQGVTMAFFEDVWSRNFLNFFASPLTIWDYLGGLVASSIATSSVGLAAMLLLAGLVFGLSFAVYGTIFIPFLMILFVFGIALGVMATALVLRLGPASEWFVWPIPALIAPFAGVFYPVSVLPRWMQVVARALPPAYVFESMRAIVMGHSAARWPVLAGAGLALAYLGLGCWIFERTYRYAVRTGLIARYSAESVN
ncbi:MAG TPA: ABC transporter permease [Elusimicrobiota bacterium]|jgi:ABC-2 type transport system permease protein|nr:ABC transporter permease [Elusimicrobiota bacterium]